MTPLVSVIIATYNRFSLLCAAVQSVREQTYTNIEIIVVNDASTDQEYYSKKIDGVTMIHLAKNTRELFGYPCAGYVRNIGARIARGEYLAFLDDDDIWLPRKLSAQISAFLSTPNVCMSCTDGYIGEQPWNYLLGASPDENSGFRVYNREHYFETLCDIYAAAAPPPPQFDLRRDGFPRTWTADFIKIHNCVITSSAVISRAHFESLGGFRELRNGEEDYDLWRRATESGENIVYVDEPHFYYLFRGNPAA